MLGIMAQYHRFQVMETEFRLARLAQLQVAGNGKKKQEIKEQMKTLSVKLQKLKGIA